MYKLAAICRGRRLSRRRKGRKAPGAERPTSSVIAVATRDGHPVSTHLRVVSGFTKEAMRDYATGNIQAGARVLTDGLACFNGFDEASLKHVVKITVVDDRPGTISNGPTRGARQCEGRHHRHVPLDRHPPHTTIPRGLRMALQPPLRSAQEPRTSSPASPSPSHPSPIARSPRSDEGKQRSYRGNQQKIDFYATNCIETTHFAAILCVQRSARCSAAATRPCHGRRARRPLRPALPDPEPGELALLAGAPRLRRLPHRHVRYPPRIDWSGGAGRAASSMPR